MDTTPAYKPPPGVLVYGLEDRLPLGASLLVGGQHVAAMIVGTITPPLILAGTLKFPPATTAYLISMALLSSALGTFLQCRRRGPVGSGLLSVTGISFAFIGVLAQAGQEGGLALMLGLSCLTAPLQVLLSPFLSRLRSAFTPIVSGVVVMLIGLSLIPTAYFNIAVPLKAGAPLWWNLLLAAVVAAIVVLTQASGRTWARVAGLAVSVLAGTAICALLGVLPALPPADGQWLTRPQFLPHGFAFRWDMALPFGFIYLISVIEAIGDMTATAQLSGLDTTGADHWRRLTGGVLADGLTSTVSALFGGFPSATYAQNNGVIQLTGVAARRIGYVMAGILAVLGLLPPVGRLITVLPPQVIGALAVILFGLVAVAGLRLVLAAGLGQREAIIVAVSLGVGIGLPSQPALLAGLPEVLKTLLGSSIPAGGLTAFLLSGLWRVKPAAPPQKLPGAAAVAAPPAPVVARKS